MANLGGVVTSTLPFMDAEGQPTVLAINGLGDEAGGGGVYLAAGTDRGFVKARDLSNTPTPTPTPTLTQIFPELEEAT